MPFCEVSHSAKVGTVAGSIDLGLLASRERPSAALLPGTLARANRGIVFVDEINRLADTSPELTDLLLDAMGTRPGRLQIEETGLTTVELPLQVTIWAASNPDEDPGPLEDIRRQLADRFDLNVNMGRARSRDTVLDILELADRTLQGLAQSPFCTPVCNTGAESPGLRRFFQTRAGRAGAVTMPRSVRRTIADLYVECGLESLRTAEAVQVCARAACALDGRDEVTLDDLRGVLPLVLGQRVEGPVLERFLARVDQEPMPRPAAAAKPGPAGTAQAPPDRGLAAAGDETGIDLAEGAAARGGPPAAGAHRHGPGGDQDAPGPQRGSDDGTALKLGLEGIFGRLMARVRARAAPAGMPGGGMSGRPNGTAACHGAGGAGTGLDPAFAPVLAPPGRARALADLPPEHALRLPDGVGGDRV